MKVRFSREAAVLLAVVVLLLASAVSEFLLPPGWFEAVTFDAVVKEDTLLLGESGQDYIYILEDGEERCVDISSHTRITDEDGRALDLTEGVELKAGQPIRATVVGPVIYEPVTTYLKCFKIAILSP